MDSTLLEEYRARLKDIPFISDYALGRVREVAPRTQADAITVPMFMALERYSWNPPYPPLKARMLRASAEMTADGYPPFAVSGVPLPADYERDPRREIRLLWKARFEAIKEFNGSGEGNIARLMVYSEDFNSLEDIDVMVNEYRAVFTE